MIGLVKMVSRIIGFAGKFGVCIVSPSADGGIAVSHNGRVVGDYSVKAVDMARDLARYLASGSYWGPFQGCAPMP